jgi:2-polyprenyl-3-methyl-5-hydroxy-6-metoxy-1,4-benzoquinol methylase
MNYTEQQQYFRNSRIQAALWAAAQAAAAVMTISLAGAQPRYAVVIFGLAITALIASLFYTPDYLHVTVLPEKPRRWQVKIRWRILGASLLLGMLCVSSLRGALMIVVVVAWLLAANFLSQKLAPPGSLWLYFWLTDSVMLAIILTLGRPPLLLAVALLLGAAHLSLVICRKYCWLWALAVTASSVTLLFLSFKQRTDSHAIFAGAGVLTIVAAATAWLVRRAQSRSEKNIATAMRELADFTGYTEEKIRDLWLTSNQQLAKNWEQASPAEDDAGQMAEWYRQNSELYMFAISAYNLEYRRIRSNLGVLRHARGSVLDYGAGNGELLLDLARRGHAVTYYDVEGTSMAFARWRAAQHGLALEITRSKEELAAAARKKGLDTVYSFDVLEHLPDLPGELSFLSSLLGPGGRMMFDVPAGSTKAHPMHLNHDLDVKKHLREKGMTEERGWWQRLLPGKQEKFIFRARA